jgi:hypothetical protein
MKAKCIPGKVGLYNGTREGASEVPVGFTQHSIPRDQRTRDYILKGLMIHNNTKCDKPKIEFGFLLCSLEELPVSAVTAVTPLSLRI